MLAPTPELRRWREIDGDHTLRLEYDLGPDSVVLDVGGFEGQWASDIAGMYGCRVEIYEPVPEFARRIERRFRRNPRVTVHACGLAEAAGTARMTVAGDASSHARDGEAVTEVELCSVRDALDALPGGSADLMKVNIEGAEYDLLEHLVVSGLIRRVRDLQVQFHLFVPDAEARVQRLREQLARTHVPTYQYDFLWENWRRRD